MNYLKARQLESTKKWHYTSENDGRIHPIGYCIEHVGHETAEEAEECYKSYQLDNELQLNRKLSGQLQKCKVCGEWTDGLAAIGYWAAVLCDRHRTREEIEKIYEIGESWES